MFDEITPCKNCNTTKHITWEGVDLEDCIIRCGKCGEETETPKELGDAVADWEYMNFFAAE